MIKTNKILMEELQDYASPKTKLSRMVEKGECFPIIRGLYETDRNTPAYLLAGSIYGPSYISFEYALSYYGLIPEAVYTITCATYDKKKKKKYNTSFGTFTYRDVPSEVFPLCVSLMREGSYWFRIASPEKALCDQLYTLPPVKNILELSAMLFDDLRVDEDALKSLDCEIIKQLSQRYHSTNVKKLSTLVRRLQN